MRTHLTSIPHSESERCSLFWRYRASPVICYTIPAISVSLALIITGWLKESFPEAPAALFYCAIILSSWIGGIGPGILASLLSILTIKYYSSPPLHTFAISLSELPRLVMLLGAGVFISWFSGEQKRAQVALRQARDELERRVNERTKELTVANEGLRAEIARSNRTETLLDGQRRVLEMMAANAPLSESLAALTRLIEERVPDMLGSILLIDKEGVHLRHGAAPSLPSEYMAAIDGVTIGPDVGSCGTAAYLKEAVIVEDIATDSRWKNHRMIALSHGLRSCWSTPIFDTQQHVVGTFAMYYCHTALPEPEHLRLIEIATHIAAIAICRDHSQAALRESEAKLNEAQRIAKIGYWERDLAADLFTWSEGTSRIFGFRPQNCTLSGAQLQEMIHPADRQLGSKAMAEALDGGPRSDLEVRIVRPDGEIRFVHVRDEIGYDAAGQPVCMFGTVQDITELKQAEESLRQVSRQNEMILDTAGEGIWGLDTDCKATFINAAGARLLGYEPHELIGQNTHVLLHHSKADNRQHLADECPIIMTLREGLMHRCSDDVFWRKDGTSIPVQYVCNPMFEGGKVCGAVVVFSDMTERKRAEESVRESEKKFSKIFQSSPIAISLSTINEGRYLDVNQEFLRTFEKSRAEVVGHTAVEIGIWNDPEHRVENMAKIKEQGTARNVELEIRGKAGQITHILWSAEVLDVCGESCLLGSSLDITEQKLAQDELQWKTAFLEAQVDSSLDGILVVDSQNRKILQNQRLNEIWKFPPHVAENNDDAGRLQFAANQTKDPDGFVKKVNYLYAHPDEVIRDEIELVDGTILDRYSSSVRDKAGRYYGRIWSFRDITELKENEQKLRQTEAELARVARLTTMGELTASIAHEVNQPLAAVVTNANAVTRWLATVPPNLDEAREAVQRIARDGNRASEVIRRIRALIKKSEPVRKPLNLNELIQETVVLTQSELTRKKVLLQTELARDLPCVAADRVQLQQVLLNLVVNAVDSLGAVAHPRVLHIRTSHSELDAVHIAVDDTGMGIELQQTERLFEPFYTTKSHGLGMGLAISRSIVEAHGGRLWATPNDSRGAKFEFTLPVQEEDEP
jgi:PAS domain S-box-containing protein